MVTYTQCSQCKHWKPQRVWGEIKYYCELTGYRSKDDWKKHQCKAFDVIEGQSNLEEFIE